MYSLEHQLICLNTSINNADKSIQNPILHKDYKVILSAFAYKLFHEDFSSILGAKYSDCDSRTTCEFQLMIPEQI